MAVTLTGVVRGVRVAPGGTTVKAPAGIAGTELAIMVLQEAGNTAFTAHLSGWTTLLLDSQLTGNMNTNILYKLGGHTVNEDLYPRISADGGATEQGAGVAMTVWYLNTSGRTPAIIGAEGGRNGTSTAVTTAPSITTTQAGQDVLLIAGERTTATGTTVSDPSGFTRLDHAEQAVNAVTTGIWYTERPAAGAVGDQTLTYNSAAGNAFAMLVALGPAFSPTVVAGTLWQSDASSTSLSLGAIISNGASVRAVVSRNADLSSPVYSTAITIPASRWANCRVSGLLPDTRYYTGLEVDGTLIATGRGNYKTLSNTLASSKVIASSCNNTGSAHAVFTQMKAENADFFTHMGDIHYANTNVESEWRTAFAASLTSSTFAPFLASTTMTYDWDNHDTGGNGSDKDDGWATFAPEAVRQLTGSIYPDARGLYRTWTHAGVRYVEIDRWLFRNDQNDADIAGKTMLGATQLAWFTNLLQTSTEPAIIVFAGFPLYSNLIQSGRWGSYTQERLAIGSVIDGLTAKQRDKLVFIAGDSHAVHADDGRNAMWNVPNLNASPLNQSGGLPSGTWNIGNIDSVDTSGYYSRITWTYDATRERLKMLWEAVDHTGAVVLTWSKFFDTSTKRPVWIKDSSFAKGRRRVFRSLKRLPVSLYGAAVSTPIRFAGSTDEQIQTWGTPENAVGSATGSYAGWSSSVSGPSGAIFLTGYDFASVIPATAKINSIIVNMRHYVSNASRYVLANCSIQLFDGQTPIGSPTPMSALSANTSGSVMSLAITGDNVPTPAQLANLRLKITFRRASTTSASTAYVDYASMQMSYSPLLAGLGKQPLGSSPLGGTA